MRRQFLFQNENNTNNQIYNNNNRYENDFSSHSNSNRNEGDIGSQSLTRSISSSLCKKLLKILYKYKFSILEIIFYIFIIICVDNFIQSNSNNFFLGGILTTIRGFFTTKRLIFLFLCIHMLKYVVNSFLYYLYGIGLIAFLYIILKNKFQDFFSLLSNK